MNQMMSSLCSSSPSGPWTSPVQHHLRVHDHVGFPKQKSCVRPTTGGSRERHSPITDPVCWSPAGVLGSFRIRRDACASVHAPARPPQRQQQPLSRPPPHGPALLSSSSSSSPPLLLSSSPPLLLPAVEPGTPPSGCRDAMHRDGPAAGRTALRGEEAQVVLNRRDSTL
ncbi:hypothetical protein EYF80_043850 [Liparis tanakae]|uniref:Uncharacterized protein n=1 Tax=Liparis tanakae TaxID=230148 RepID=A0A4Z2FXM3_9TELE|nr:hypothetical protein EYF80_043850 [Liparis tanakae]